MILRERFTDIWTKEIKSVTENLIHEISILVLAVKITGTWQHAHIYNHWLESINGLEEAYKKGLQEKNLPYDLLDQIA